MTALPIRIGASNVTGLGAVQLANSLLPAFERLAGIIVETVYLPDRGSLADWQSASSSTLTARYRRTLPHALSRLIECGTTRQFYAGTTPLLTLGDLPVRTRVRQLAFVQSPHLTDSGSLAPKYLAVRALFRANLRYADAIVVQTAAMRDAMLRTHPIDPARLHIIAQPPPEWLNGAGLRRTGRVRQGALSLFYPAADYPHKNHALLGRIDAGRWTGLVDKLVLTIAPHSNPAPALRLIDCVGQLDPADVIAGYRQTDALLFLSRSESYGFPLVEAMTVGLPIVAPDLPYARTLCGDGAIYFDQQNVESLRAALETLHGRLAAGWWPDWRAQLRAIPPSWDAVATRLAALLYPG